jgi:hypothetical protein
VKDHYLLCFSPVQAIQVQPWNLLDCANPTMVASPFLRTCFDLSIVSFLWRRNTWFDFMVSATVSWTWPPPPELSPQRLLRGTGESRGSTCSPVAPRSHNLCFPIQHHHIVFFPFSMKALHITTWCNMLCLWYCLFFGWFVCAEATHMCFYIQALFVNLDFIITCPNGIGGKLNI